MTEPDFIGVVRILAAADDSAATLPDADLIWERAVARAEWRRRESAVRVIRLAERIALIACITASIAVSIVVRSTIYTVVRATDEKLVGLEVLSVIVVLGTASIFLKMLLADE